MPDNGMNETKNREVCATVSFATLGCKTNQFETAAMQERLTGAGYRLMPFEEGAGLVIVNTCTVTGATDAQSRKLVRRARRLNPDCRVVVTGCYAQVDPQVFADMPGVSLVIGNQEKQQLLELLEADADQARVAVSKIRPTPAACLSPLTSFAGRSRAFVQIQNGCDAFCSYCIIPYARGGSRSAAPDGVVDQVRTLVAAGYPEIVLTGIHIGGYGLDMKPAASLLELVGRIERETDLSRLRLGSIEPTEISAALIEAVAASAIVCPHFHIPLQSGDDAVLRRMGRNYDRNYFHQLVRQIHEHLPDAAVGLDVITGFPGETESEFANTRALIADLPVSHLHVFPFSRRPGTPAAAMSGQVPGRLSRTRAARLRDLGEEKLRIFAERFVGRRLEVVVEAGPAGRRLKGISRNYLDVYFDGPRALCGKVAMIEVTAAKGLHLLGQAR
jgi:threonylcarbamoyladenosine tRNA methylthiotransferase MtaB